MPHSILSGQDPNQIVPVLQEAIPHERIDHAKFSRQVLLDPNFDPRGSWLALEDGKVAGYVLAMHRKVPLENAAPDFDRGYITLFGVSPAFQNRGIGTHLLRKAEDYLKECGCTSIWMSSYAPGYFCPGVDVEAYSAGLDFLTKRGYVEIYRPIAMEVPLAQLVVPHWVVQREKDHDRAGLKYLLFDSALVRPLLEFAERDFPGDWVRVCRQTALQILNGDSPERLQIAVDTSGSHPTVVGFSHFDRERFGPIGVDPNRRGQGIGQVLMYRTLQSQVKAGLQSAYFMWSDDKTAARLYDAAGFRLMRRFALLKKDIMS